MPALNDDLENNKSEVETHKLEVETHKLELEANNLEVETRNDEVRSYSSAVFWGVIAVGGVTVGVLVAVLAGFLLGHYTHVRTKTVAARTITQRVTTPSGASRTPAVAPVTGVARTFGQPNGDAFNTRDVSSPINSSNVSALRLASTIPVSGKTQAFYADTPVFSPDGSTEYLIDLNSNVTAVTVATGKVLWRHDYNIADEGPNGLNYTNGVIYGTTGTYAFALTATTGKQLWRTPVIEKPGRANGQDVDSAPGVSDGKVFVATSGQVHAGLIFAFDAKTGKKLWTFNTDKNPADRTGKSAASAPLPGSGGAWEAPLIADGTVYFGIGNAYRSPNEALKTPEAFLYNDSIVALNPNTGKLKWYYQGVPNDFYDWDMQISPIYVHDGGQSTVIDAGKMGFVYAYDPTTGKLLWKRSVGIHNGHDNDGKLALQGKLKLKYPYTILPGTEGGVLTNMAEANGVVYVPVVDDATVIKSANESAEFPLPQGTGEMVAVDVKTGEVLWDTKLPSSPDGDATVTNDLVFTTLLNGTLVAYSTKTGKLVYQTKIPNGLGTFTPVSITGSTLVTGRFIYRLGAKGSVPSTTTPAAKTTPAASTTAPAGSIPIAAAASGSLMYSTTTLSAKAGKDTFVFTNKSPVPHNFTIMKGSKVIGATPTFAKGVKTLTVTLAAGTYTFECTVPGHAAAGMKGTLTVT